MKARVVPSFTASQNEVGVNMRSATQGRAVGQTTVEAGRMADVNINNFNLDEIRRMKFELAVNPLDQAAYMWKKSERDAKAAGGSPAAIILGGNRDKFQKMTADIEAILIEKLQAIGNSPLGSRTQSQAAFQQIKRALDAVDGSQCYRYFASPKLLNAMDKAIKTLERRDPLAVKPGAQPLRGGVGDGPTKTDNRTDYAPLKKVLANLRGAAGSPQGQKDEVLTSLISGTRVVPIKPGGVQEVEKKTRFATNRAAARTEVRHRF